MAGDEEDHLHPSMRLGFGDIDMLQVLPVSNKEITHRLTGPSPRDEPQSRPFSPDLSWVGEPLSGGDGKNTDAWIKESGLVSNMPSPIITACEAVPILLTTSQVNSALNDRHTLQAPGDDDEGNTKEEDGGFIEDEGEEDDEPEIEDDEDEELDLDEDDELEEDTEEDESDFDLEEDEDLNEEDEDFIFDDEDEDDDKDDYDQDVD